VPVERQAALAYEILDTAFLLRRNELVADGHGPDELPPLRARSADDHARRAHRVPGRRARRPPNSILAITFTTAAAATLRTRLVTVRGSAATRVDIRTFHSFGLKVIRTWSEELQ